jgi:putative Holliday junction resolvase
MLRGVERPCGHDELYLLREQATGGYCAMVIVALDVGQARIGVATCDAEEVLASPHSVIRRTSNAAAFEAIARVVAEAGAALIVVGLPISLDRELHGQAQSVQAFAEKLRRRLSVPLVYADETLSTWRAEEMLRASGMRPERIPGRIDAAAAAVILQDFLDERHRQQVSTEGHQDTSTPPASDAAETE